MADYNCFRCGYCTNHKTKIRLHLDRKNICKPILRDINLDQYGKDILNGNEFDETVGCSILLHSAPSLLHSAPFCSKREKFECVFCKKNYIYNRNLNKHLKTCKSKQEQEGYIP